MQGLGAGPGAWMGPGAKPLHFGEAAAALPRRLQPRRRPLTARLRGRAPRRRQRRGRLRVAPRRNASLAAPLPDAAAASQNDKGLECAVWLEARVKKESSSMPPPHSAAAPPSSTARSTSASTNGSTCSPLRNMSVTSA